MLWTGLVWKMGKKPCTQPWILHSALGVLQKHPSQSQLTYRDFEVDGFVTNLPVDHGGFQEGSKEKELLHLPSAVLPEKS